MKTIAGQMENLKQDRPELKFHRNILFRLAIYDWKIGLIWKESKLPSLNVFAGLNNDYGPWN
jgi:hypothetical protein